MSYYVTKINENGNIAVDDTLLVKGAPAAAGSKILEGFEPLFSAEAVVRLEDAGYTVKGKTKVGEFGLDLVGEFGVDANPTLKGAAAQAVADDDVTAALGVDLNGAPRRAAAISGVNFIKPTYGTVSRYGVIAAACSGEQVGVYAKTVKSTAAILSSIAGHDAKDGTSLANDSYDYDTDLDVKGSKVLVIKELFDAADDTAKAKVDAFAEALKANGVVVETASFETVFEAQAAWQILMSAETCNNPSRYDGVKFGYRTPNYNNIDELYVNTRTEGMNLLTKATILYGSDTLSKGRYTDCYDKSLKVRRVVYDKVKELFGSYDAILTPALSSTGYNAYSINDAFLKVYGESLFTAIPNLIGIPALVSGGVQLMGNHFDESMLFSLASKVERSCK